MVVEEPPADVCVVGAVEGDVGGEVCTAGLVAGDEPCAGLDVCGAEVTGFGGADDVAGADDLVGGADDVFGADEVDDFRAGTGA